MNKQTQIGLYLNLAGLIPAVIEEISQAVKDDGKISVTEALRIFTNLTPKVVGALGPVIAD